VVSLLTPHALDILAKAPLNQRATPVFPWCIGAAMPAADCSANQGSGAVFSLACLSPNRLFKLADEVVYHGYFN
jgi:hypothetical protein